MAKTINIHGYISMLIFLIALIIADYVLFQQAALLGAIYMLVIVAGLVFIALTYCVKCSVRKRCNHFIPGLISRLMGYQDKEYTNSNLVTTLSSIFIIIALPQYWLFAQLKLLFVFWALLLIAGIEINFFVCKTCGNKKCSMCKTDC